MVVILVIVLSLLHLLFALLTLQDGYFVTAILKKQEI